MCLVKKAILLCNVIHNHLFFPRHCSLLLHKVKLVPCFYDDIVPTLAIGWETGAVIKEEVLPNNQWEVGPCSSDGFLKRR